MAKFNVSVELDYFEEDGSLDDELKSEIVSKIVSEVAGSITKSLETEANRLLNAKMEALDEEISQKLNDLMQEFFNTPRDITDSWGDIVESGVTVTQKLKKACDEFMHQPVDENGKATKSSWAKYKTRVDYIVHKSIDWEMEQAIKNAVGTATKQIREQVKGLATKQLGEKLAEVVGLEDIIGN